MPCPFNPDAGGERDRGADEDAFRKSALVIGGADALGTLVGAYGAPDARGRDPADRDPRQHDWGGEAPAHHLLLTVDYLGDGAPTDADRRTVARALSDLEAALGTGADGVVVTVGYAPSYFDRFGADLPGGLREQGGVLPDTEATVAAMLSDREVGTEVRADGRDAVVHLAGDHVAHLLAAELALYGDENALGLELSETLDGVFSRPESFPERRVGFDEDSPVPGTGDAEEPAPAAVSLGEEAGPFRDGTLMHLSTIDVDPSAFRRGEDGDGPTEGPPDGRATGEESVRDHVRTLSDGGSDAGGCPRDGGAGRPAADGSVPDGDPEATAATGEPSGDAGPHARRLLRRGVTATERETRSSHFVAYMRRIEHLVEARRAMNEGGDRLTAALETRRRGNYLVPPVERRALPRPDGAA